MITLISYASDNMTISQERLVCSAYKYGVDNVISFGRKDIDENFYLTNKEILDAERGAGYWLWKPYIINKTINKLNEGDILIYSDAGIEIVEPIQYLINCMDENIWFFCNGWPHVQWSKADMNKAILGGIEEPMPVRNDCRYSQVQASWIMFRVNDEIKRFVAEWLAWCQIPGFIDDSPSKETNHYTFTDNRHDQSVLTALQIKYGYKKHWWASTIWIPEKFRYPNDNYPAMFLHHRMRNEEYKTKNVYA